MIAPYRDDSLTLEDYSNLVTLAATAWNLSVFPAEERESALQRALQTVPPLRRQDRYVLIQDLLERKEQLFPDDVRLVSSAEVVEERDQFRIIVASLAAEKH